MTSMILLQAFMEHPHEPVRSRDEIPTTAHQQVTVTDVFVEHTNFPFNKFPKMYQWFSSKPQLWDAVYKTSQLTSDSILG